MIAGIDGQNDPYLCYPQNTGGLSKRFGPTKKMTTLDEAVVLDDVLGQEEIVAVFCDDPLKYEGLAKILKTVRTQKQAVFSMDSNGCRHRIIKLNKTTMETE